MKLNLKAFTAVLAVIAIGGLSAGCKKLEARDNLNKGVAAFKNQKFPEAVEFFKTSLELDPSFYVARTYLATAYMSQYIPGAESPDNMAHAKNAYDEFQKVLDVEPNNATAIESIASLFFLQAQGAQKDEDKDTRLTESQKWYKKLTEVDPGKKEAWYSLGVIAWAKWYKPWTDARTKAGMKPEQPGPLKDPKVRAELTQKYGAMINEGIANLQKSLDIDKEYDDAMAYMNLLIRERADLADSPEVYRKDTEAADTWMQKALETRKIKAEREAKKAGGGLVEGQ